jgi:hypothetical protein
MYDYAHVHLLGRAIDDAEFVNNSDNKISKATFTVACNISFKRREGVQVRTIYRKVLVLGSLAKYVQDCQEGDEDGLRGRLISLAGMMDNALSEDREDVILINYVDGGFLKIMDRRISDE